jgi:NAD(P)-dependent dehydrogenase (short-subunit alcohol dehydrogenase family)
MSNYLQTLFGLDGQVAVVVGGTGVLGGALADAVAQAGALVVVAGRSEQAGAERVAAIRQAGGQAEFFGTDVANRKSLEELLAFALKFTGRVDILINCAGVNAASPYLEADDTNWQRVLDINLNSTHYGCQIFGKQMVEQGGGAILNIGSVSADKPLSRVFAYSASKAAVVNLTQNVAREFAPNGVRVNCLCPGFFPAEQNRAILSKERVENIMRNTPMERFGTPDELAGAALLLLSAKAGSFITGATVYVDGGFTAMRI